MVSVTLDLSQYKDISKLTKDAQRTGMQKTGQFMISQLMMRSPVDHGLLRQWAAVSQSDSEIVIRSPAFYAGWVNYGHSQQPGRFIPGNWQGGKFRYNRNAKTGMVLKKSHVAGKKFVEASINATAPRIKEFFTIKG